MKYGNILESALGHKSKIRLLRKLLMARSGLTGRQLSRIAGIHHRTAHAALKEFASHGIVIMDVAGRAILYKINRNNIIVQRALEPLFRFEEQLLPETVRRLLNKAPVRVISAILFGSIAQSRERGTSDFDILFLVANDKNKSLLAKHIETQEFNFIVTYGNKLSPLVVTLGEFARRTQKKDRFLLNVIRKGKSIYGKSIQEVLIVCRQNQ